MFLYFFTSGTSTFIFLEQSAFLKPNKSNFTDNVILFQIKLIFFSTFSCRIWNKSWYEKWSVGLSSHIFPSWRYIILDKWWHWAKAALNGNFERAPIHFNLSLSNIAIFATIWNQRESKDFCKPWKRFWRWQTLQIKFSI